MSRTLEFLRLMSDGKPRTVADLATACNCSMSEAHVTLQNIRKRKATRSLGTPYVLTPEGLAYLERRETRRVVVEQNARKRGRPRIHPEKIKAPKNSIVASALSGAPALQMVWRNP